MALRQSATQSETLWSYDAVLAVDGDPNTCSFTPQSDVQRWWQVHLSGSPRIGSVAITMSPGQFQHFTIFVVQLLEGNKAMYKPCAEFEGRFQEQKAFFKCKEGHSGQFVYIRDDREDKEYFGLCEVEVFHYKETPECGDPEKPIYGLVKVHGDMAHYGCIPGYTMRGNATRKCSWTGWKGKVPDCVEVQCDHPPSAKEGFIEVSNFKGSYIYGSKATYHCNPGYILWGNATRLCNAAGQWTGTAPKCQPIACGDPVTFAHTSVALLNGSTVWRAVAQYSCIHGYVFTTGNRSVLESRCLQNGSWTPIDVTCVPNSDMLAMHPRNGGGDSFLVGLSSTNVHSTVSSPVLLTIVVIATVVFGTAISVLAFAVRKWFQKLSTNSPQHFILSTNSRPKFKDLGQAISGDGASPAVSNPYASIPVAYTNNQKPSEGEQPSTQGGPNCDTCDRDPCGVEFVGSLPRRHVQLHHQQIQPGFKYADASEIASATLRHTCLQPQVAVSSQALPHHYANFHSPNLSIRSHHGSRQQQFSTLPHHRDRRRQPDQHQESVATESVPDILQQTASEESSSSQDRHVIVNQLLTFLNDNRVEPPPETSSVQQHQLVDLEDEMPSVSTTSTLRLSSTDPPTL